ncbi:Hsp70 family protein [Thiocystis violacea]|uniref:Hsp70 family protein n=1 Tax=Thiocystis violacea TaxID=13725 RepID=UPI001904B114|nr:Hsp70 family protein [Thiocystis violacea]MBK1717007.1 molecular chaperone-like protein [Thiocystis violacea]
MSANSASTAPMSADPKPVLAIDFGTSNTYVTKCPGDKEDPVGVDFGDGRDGIATAILYRDDKAPLIGHVALEEFGDAGAEHADYRLHAQFKPDLVSSAEARTDARDFLAGLLALARRQNKDIAPLQRQVIFGVPSEASETYRETLRAIAHEAGFGEVKTVDEPKGALYFHLQRKDITPIEALKGALVVDFGGGTCDFALVVRGEILHSWGDMHLGGRLFDDLFYQWFIEQNPEAVAAMRRERAEFFVLAVRCREVKEKFSLAMALDPTTVYRKTLGEYGRIDAVTWESFLARAGRYRPSETFSQYLRAMNPQAGAHLDSFPQGVDLLDWFRQTLRQGLAHEQVRHQDLACVILTGGSSAWPFVADIVVDELRKIDRSPRLVHSDRPYVTVSQGLAIVPALQRRLAATQIGLRAELPEFIDTRIAPLIERRMDEAASRIAELVAVGLFDGRIEPILRRFRQEGGSVADLKSRLTEDAAAFRPQLEAIVTTQLAKVLTGVAADTTELMQDWYRQHRLTVDQSLTHAGTPVDMAEGLRLADVDVYGEITGVVLALSTTLVTVLVATISGGAGTAFVMSGPLGLLVGALIGLIAGALAMRYGTGEAKRRAEQWEGAPLWLLARALSDTKIARLRDDLKGQVADKVSAQSEQARQELEDQIRERVEREIASLSAISQIW